MPPRTAGGVGSRDRAPLAPVIGLSVTAGLAAIAALIAAVTLLVEPAPIQGLESLAERQDAESLLYVAAFGVVLPIAAVLVPRAADAVARGPNAGGLSVLAAGLALALAAVLACVRVSDAWSWGGGGGALLVGMVLWWSLAIAAIARARSASTWSALERGRARARPLWTAAGLLTLALAASTADPGSVSPVGLAVAAAVAVAAVVARRRLPALRSRRGLALDLGVLVLILLVVPDLVVFKPEDTLATKAVVYENKIIRFHHDFLLGPANQVMHGHTMLVDTASQYGVGSIVFLAGWFKLLPISYGDFGLLDGILTALVFATGYLVLRLVGVGRALATGALALGVGVLVYNLVYPLGGLPQQGPLRFGLPILVVLAAVAGERWPRRATAALVAQLFAVGLSAIWALEAFAYTLGTFAGLAAFRAFLLPEGRIRYLLRQLVAAVAACATAQLLFAVATLLAAGDLPQWGQYFAYLKEFLSGALGDLTYDFSRNSAGLALGAGYLVSAVALVVLVRRDRALAERERALLTALTGTTAYGALLFTYFVNRSADHIVPYVSLPLLLAATLWLALVLRETPGGYPRRLALSLSLAAAVGLFGIAWSSIGSGFERSAAAHVLPGGDSFTAAIDRLKAFPPTSLAAAGGERALERWLPGQDTSLVIVNPNAVTEVLIRAKRGNRLPLAHPWEDSFVQSERIPGLRREVARLRAGDRMLVDQGALGALRPGEGRDAVRRSRPGAAIAPVQLWTLTQIARRFALKPIHRDPAGFVVVELTPRR